MEAIIQYVSEYYVGDFPAVTVYAKPSQNGHGYGAAHVEHVPENYAGEYPCAIIYARPSQKAEAEQLRMELEAEK